MAYMDDRYMEREYYYEEEQFHGRAPQWEAPRQTDDKFRRLPCRTFISTGTCPYRERCVYLHDPRIATKNVKSKSRKKNKDDVTTDSWFWPVMPDDELQLDHSCQPVVNQCYIVPIPRFDHCSFHNRSVYSIWMHFVEYCIDTAPRSTERTNMLTAHGQHQVFCHPSEVADFRAGRRKAPSVVNMYSGQKRLEVFIHMSNGGSFESVEATVSVAPLSTGYTSQTTVSPPTVAATVAMSPMMAGIASIDNKSMGGSKYLPFPSSQAMVDGDWDYANFAAASVRVPPSAPVAEIFYHQTTKTVSVPVGKTHSLSKPVVHQSGVPGPIAAHWGGTKEEPLKAVSSFTGLPSISLMW